MRVTIKRIAEELGISHSTVSRVLNEKQSTLVSAATRERITQAADRMGYRPNRLAQALQGKDTNLVGVFVPDEEDWFFQCVIRNLLRTVELSGYELIVFASPRDRIRETWYRLLQWNLDGVFLFDYPLYIEGLWEAMTRHYGPVPPVIGLFSSHTKLQDHISVDFRPALRDLVNHFQCEGCRRIGYVGPPGSLNPGEQRYRGISDFTAEHGMERVDIPLVPGEILMESARKTIGTFLAKGDSLPDALFCQNDEIALGVYRGLSESGVSVPGDVLLAGCDNIPYMSYLPAPLTSLSLPVEEVCREAWEILKGRMTDPEQPPTRVVLETVLHLRASCLRAP